jgi:hypothetical protein
MSFKFDTGDLVRVIGRNDPLLHRNLTVIKRGSSYNKNFYHVQDRIYKNTWTLVHKNDIELETI